MTDAISASALDQTNRRLSCPPARPGARLRQRRACAELCTPHRRTGIGRRLEPGSVRSLVRHASRSGGQHATRSPAHRAQVLPVSEPRRTALLRAQPAVLRPAPTLPQPDHRRAPPSGPHAWRRRCARPNVRLPAAACGDAHRHRLLYTAVFGGANCCVSPWLIQSRAPGCFASANRSSINLGWCRCRPTPVLSYDATCASVWGQGSTHGRAHRCYATRRRDCMVTPALGSAATFTNCSRQQGYATATAVRRAFTT